MKYLTVCSRPAYPSSSVFSLLRPTAKTVRQRLLPAILACVSIGSSILFSHTAWAQYTPPEGPPPSGPTVSNGSRTGCGDTGSIPLTVLAPTQHVAYTASPNPILMWYVPATVPYLLDVSLYQVGELDTSRQLIYQYEAIEDASGLFQFTVPESELMLTPGERYLWQVAIACDPNSPANDQTIVAELEVVDVPDAIATALANAQTLEEQSQIYAQNGYWYDALQSALRWTELFDDQPPTTVPDLLAELADVEGGIHAWYLEQMDLQLPVVVE